MNEKSKVDNASGGVNPSSAGSTINEPSGNIEQDKTVTYSTYKKVLSQEKNLRARLEEANAVIAEKEAKEKAEEEKRLSEQGEYKKLLELERKKREELEGKTKDYERSILDAHKLNAFKEKLGGRVANPAYYDFVDLDNIVINPETGEIDSASVQAVVDKFVVEHSPLIKQSRPTLPNQAPRDNNLGTLSYEQWKSLPLKERQKRMAEVMEADKELK